MKWQAASPHSRADRKRIRDNRRGEWHRSFALLPHATDKRVHEDVVVPRLWVWLEPIEQRRRYDAWEYRVWNGETKTLDQQVDDA